MEAQMHFGKRSAALFLVVSVLGFQYQEPVLAQASLRYGTWKLNLATSSYSPGPAPKSEVRTYKANGNGLANTIDRVEVDGSHTAIHWAALLDGKDYPYVGSPIYDTIAITSVDNVTIASTQKKSGKVVVTSKSVVSRDGKTLTVTTNGTDGTGKPLHNVSVFEKQ
jgi:hypothetical protein